ncbi:unnamed protein product [Effrenium voratum]|nr:unnamed protein product [Effrenium voratum]
MQWRPLARLPPSVLREPRLHELLGGAPAVLDLGGSALAEALARWRGIVSGSGGLHLDVRPLHSVARSGGGFGAPKRLTLAEWQSGDGPLVFDTRRGSDLHRALKIWTLPEAKALWSWSRSPVATLGKPDKREGLAFHRHERNWLLLLTGAKRWYFHEAPSTALERVSEETLKETEVGGLTHQQQPGELMLLPDGIWHCTYNCSGSITLGLGGMGRLRSAAEAFCAFGDCEALRKVPLDVLSAEAAQLCCTAAEQDQLPALKCLHELLGAAALQKAYSRTATPLHVAAGAGAMEVLTWLLEARAFDTDVRDEHGATPGHWAARSGKVEVLSHLWEAGADLQAREQHSGCSPLHLMAAEGHEAAALWLLDHGGKQPLDTQGRLPEDWAAAAGHKALAERLAAERAARKARASARS